MQVDSLQDIQELASAPQKATYDVISPVDILNHEEKDVGKFTLFPL